MKRITDEDFKYTPSFATDLRKKFERIRREQKAKQKAAKQIIQEQQQKLVRMKR